MDGTSHSALASLWEKRFTLSFSHARPPVWILVVVAVLVSTLSHARGFNDNFVAATGNFNGDSLLDIYVYQKPRVVPVDLDGLTVPIVLRPDVQPFVLQQQAGGTYTIVTPLTAQQRAIVAQWPRASSLTLLSSDLNLDGVRDLIVKGIAGTAAGTHDQLVFTNAVSSTSASSARRIDADLSSFMEDAYKWVEEENYFEIKSFYNHWYTRQDGATKTAWWRVSYLDLWGYVASDGVAFLEYPQAATDPNELPHGCGSLHVCDFDDVLLEWYIYGTATEHTAVFDDFNIHFNDDAVTFAKGTHASMQVLANIIAGKLQVPSIGGGERALVARESSVDSVPVDDDVFWDDLLLRVVLHDNYCGITAQCLPSPTPIQRVDIYVARLGEGAYQSSSCSNTLINYTHGVYQLTAFTPDVTRRGFTLERGGPDSTDKASNNDDCTNKPKRIPQGTYTFSIGGTSRNKWQNVPTLVTTGIGRTDILIHSAAGAQGSIGCILVSKTSGATGTFVGGKTASDQALAEIRTVLGYTGQFKYNYGYVTIENFPNPCPICS